MEFFNAGQKVRMKNPGSMKGVGIVREVRYELDPEYAALHAFVPSDADHPKERRIDERHRRRVVVVVEKRGLFGRVSTTDFEASSLEPA